MDFKSDNQTQPSAFPAPSVPDEATVLKRNETDEITLCADGIDDHGIDHGHEKKALETTLRPSLDTPDMPVIPRNTLESTNNSKHDLIALQPENNEQLQATSIPLLATKPTHLASYTPSENSVEQKSLTISIPTLKAPSGQIINVQESQTISESASSTPLDADSTQPPHQPEPEHFTIKMAENSPEGPSIPPEAPPAADQSRPTSASVTVSSSEELSTRESIQTSEPSESASTDDASRLVPQPPQSSTIVPETMAYASRQSIEASVMRDSCPESDNVHTNLSIPVGKPSDATPSSDTVSSSDTINSCISEPCTTEDIASNPNDNPYQEIAPTLPLTNATECPGKSPENAFQVSSSSSKEDNPTSTPSIESASNLTPDDSAPLTSLPPSSTTPANEAQVEHLSSDALNDQNIPAEPSDPPEAPSDAPSGEQPIPTSQHAADATHDSTKHDENRDETPAKVADTGFTREPPHDNNMVIEALESTSGQLNHAAVMAESTLTVACSDTPPVISLDDLEEATFTTDTVPPHDPVQPTPEPASPPPIENNVLNQVPDNYKTSDDYTGYITGSASLPLSTIVETCESTTEVVSNEQDVRLPHNPDPQTDSEEAANADTCSNSPATEAEVPIPVPMDVASPVSTLDARVEVPLHTPSPADPASFESAAHQATSEVTHLELITTTMSDSAEPMTDSHDTAVSLPEPVTVTPSPDSMLNSSITEVNQPVPQDASTPEDSDDLEAIEGAPAMTENSPPPETSASKREAEAAPSPEEPSPELPQSPPEETPTKESTPDPPQGETSKTFTETKDESADHVQPVLSVAGVVPEQTPTTEPESNPVPFTQPADVVEPVRSEAADNSLADPCTSDVANHEETPEASSSTRPSDQAVFIVDAPATETKPHDPSEADTAQTVDADPSQPESPTLEQLPSDTDAANNSVPDVQVTDGSSDIQQTASAPTEIPAETSPGGEMAKTTTVPQAPMGPFVDATVVLLTKEGELDLPTPADECQQATEAAVAIKPDEPVPSAPMETDEPSDKAAVIQPEEVDSVVATEPTSDATEEASPASPTIQGNLASSDTSGDPTNTDDTSPENDLPVPLAVRTPESSSGLPVTGPVEDSPAIQETQLTDASSEPLMTQQEHGAADAQIQENPEPFNVSDETPTNTTEATPEQAATEPEASAGVPAANSLANVHNAAPEASLILSVGKPTSLEGAQHLENAEEIVITDKTADSADQLTDSQDTPVVSDKSPAANPPVDAGLDQITTVAPAPATEPTTAADTTESRENIEAATAAADSSPSPKATELSEDALEPAPTAEQAPTVVPASTTSAENPEPVEKIEGAVAEADSIPSPKATDSSEVVVPTSEQASIVMLPNQPQTPSESNKSNPTECETSKTPINASADQAPADLSPLPESPSDDTSKYQEPPSAVSIVADQTSTHQESATQDIDNKNDAAPQEALATADISTPTLPDGKSVAAPTPEIANREYAPDASSTESAGPVVTVEAAQDGTAEPPNVNEAATAPLVGAPAPTDTTSETGKNTESSELQGQTSDPSPPPDSYASPHEVVDIQVTETDSQVSFEQPLHSASVSSPTPLESQRNVVEPINEAEAENPDVVEAEKPSDGSTPSEPSLSADQPDTTWVNATETLSEHAGAEDSAQAPANPDEAAAALEPVNAGDAPLPPPTENVGEEAPERAPRQLAEATPTEGSHIHSSSADNNPEAPMKNLHADVSSSDVVTPDQSQGDSTEDANPAPVEDNPKNPSINPFSHSHIDDSVSSPLPTPADATDPTPQIPVTPNSTGDTAASEDAFALTADDNSEQPSTDAEATTETSQPPENLDPPAVLAPTDNVDVSSDKPTTAADVPPPASTEDASVVNAVTHFTGDSASSDSPEHPEFNGLTQAETATEQAPESTEATPAILDAATTVAPPVDAGLDKEAADATIFIPADNDESPAVPKELPLPNAPESSAPAAEVASTPEQASGAVLPDQPGASSDEIDSTLAPGEASITGPDDTKADNTIQLSNPTSSVDGVPDPTIASEPKLSPNPLILSAVVVEPQVEEIVTADATALPDAAVPRPETSDESLAPAPSTKEITDQDATPMNEAPATIVDSGSTQLEDNASTKSSPSDFPNKKQPPQTSSTQSVEQPVDQQPVSASNEISDPAGDIQKTEASPRDAPEAVPITADVCQTQLASTTEAQLPSDSHAAKTPEYISQEAESSSEAQLPVSAPIDEAAESSNLDPATAVYEGNAELAGQQEPASLMEDVASATNEAETADSIITAEEGKQDSEGTAIHSDGGVPSPPQETNHLPEQAGDVTRTETTTAETTADATVDSIPVPPETQEMVAEPEKQGDVAGPAAGSSATPESSIPAAQTSLTKVEESQTPATQGPPVASTETKSFIADKQTPDAAADSAPVLPEAQGAAAESTEASGDSSTKPDDSYVVDSPLPTPAETSELTAELADTNDATGDSPVIPELYTPAAEATSEEPAINIEESQALDHQNPPIVSTEAESPVAIEQTPQLAQDTSAATPENQYDVVDCSNASGDPGVSPDDSPSVSSPAATPAEVADPDASTTADVRADQSVVEVVDSTIASHPKENADQQLSITAAPVGPEDCVALDSLDFTPAEERASTEKSSDAQDATVEAPAVPQQSSTPTANQPAEAAPPTAEELTTEGASPAHPIAEKVNDPPSQPEASATVSELVPVNDDNAPSPRTEVPTDSTEGKDVANAPEQVPVPTADTTPAGPASEEVPTSEPVGVDTAEPVTPQLDVPPATEPSTMASSAEAKSDLKSGKHADSDANSIQEPLEKTIVDNNSALPSKSAMSSYLRAFLDSPPPSSTSVPKPPVDQATTAKVWPGAPAVSNVKREILLPARMKKLSMASTSSRHSLFVKDLAAFSFPSFIPATPKPTLNDSTSPVISTTGPSTPVPCVSPLQNLDASPSSPTKAKPMNYRRSKLVKLSPSLKRARVVDSVDHRAWRSSYRSATLRNKNAPPVIDGASMVQRTRSHKLLEFGIRPHSPKKRSTRMEQNNDLSDAFAIIQLSDATTYNPRADRYVNPTLGRRLSTSVKDIVLKRQNRDLLKKAPLDDVYVAEDFHFDLDKELANLPESFSEDDFEPVELGTAGPSGSSQRESRIHEESNFRRSVDSKPSTKESVLSNDPKGKKHHRIRSKLAGATISLSDKTARF